MSDPELLKNRLETLESKRARIVSGEMQCWQPGSPKSEQELKQKEALARVDFHIREIKAELSPATAEKAK